MYRSVGKRLFDLVLSLVSLTVLSPIMAAIAVAIRLDDHGPVMFKQLRVGMNGRLFTFLKFRSMPIDTRDVQSSAAETLKITRVGKVIRRTNLDELPQLVNIVRGDMSIVGPRPPLPAQVDLIEMRRTNGSLSLKPGLTGLAQVNSFDGMTPAEKAMWDGRYARTVSLRTDAVILLRTLRYLTKPPPTY